MYRTVYDLNKAELDELRDAMFWGDDEGFLEENGIIVMDEPEVHLHPEWQIVSKSLIIIVKF